MPSLQQAMAQGLTAHQQGHFGRAQAIYEAITTQVPDHPVAVTAWANLALLHERHNRTTPAEHCAHQALQRHPGHPVAALVLARCMRRQGDFQAALSHLQSVDEQHLTNGLLFERGRTLDRLGRHEDAYRSFQLANQRSAANFPSAQRSLLPRLMARLLAATPQHAVAQWSTVQPGPRPAPLFLVGFNRSGTTLLDRMLNAHPQLAVLEEVPAMDAAQQALGGLYPDTLGHLDQQAIERARAAYFAVVDQHVPAEFAGLRVDKLPLNTISLGLIYRLFPQARVVCSLRHPADVVLSNFMQPYQPNAITIHFADLQSAANLYAGVMNLGLHFQRVLPLPVLRVRYEDLIADWEGEVRRLLAFAGLSWDPSMAQYRGKAQTHTHINTPSYDQVVEPLYARSIDRWKQYRNPLAPIWPTLRPFLDEFGYTAP